MGGYGRKELHPKSDIDLLILIKRRKGEDQRIGEFVRLLWDLNLEIGHSVRTVKECLQEARRDLTVMTTLCERRLLDGSPRLSADLDKALANKRLWPSNRFFEGKRKEQEERHERFSDIEYGLEPNIKSSPGGLRDIQTVYWITQRHCNTTRLSELTELGILTEKECATLLNGRDFLWRIRFALHLLTKRKEDQLYFEHQRTIAECFDYQDSEGLLAVEAFMRDYYRSVLELREVNDILIQHFSEVVMPRRRRVRVESINERFRLHNEYIETLNDKVFVNTPSAMLEMFVIMANREDIKGVRANTIRLIRQNLGIINDSFRQDTTISALFLQLLKAPYTVVSQLTRMRRYGILGEYIPEFGRVIGQMQHDLFHIYTVDAHTMALLRNLRRMFMPEYEDLFPFLGTVVSRIPKVELLFLAGLFHDIGKGRGGNHSALGANSARDFCRQLGLESEDQELVAWLVQRHLLMSTTSQKEDLSDPASIYEFAKTVQSEERLNYLFALTVADIHATNPKEWNPWRESLLIQLYNATQGMLEREQFGPDERIQEVEHRQQAAAEILESRQLKYIELESLWVDVRDGFVLAHSPERLAEIAITIKQQSDEPQQAIVKLFPSKETQLLEIFLYTQDRLGLFCDCVMALDALHLDVMNAHIATGKSGFCYDTFVVMGDPSYPLNEKRLDHIRSFIQDVVERKRKATAHSGRRISRQLMQFHQSAEVKIGDPNQAGLSRIEITTTDRPGLLVLIVSLFMEFGIAVHQSRITTLGERVEDHFLVNLSDRRPLTDSYDLADLQQQISTRINEEFQLVAN